MTKNKYCAEQLLESKSRGGQYTIALTSQENKNETDVAIGRFMAFLNEILYIICTNFACQHKHPIITYSHLYIRCEPCLQIGCFFLRFGNYELRKVEKGGN